jgi:hypothetical protein
MGGSEPESEATPVPYRPVDVTGRRIRPQRMGSRKEWGQKNGVRSFFATFIGKNPRKKAIFGIIPTKYGKERPYPVFLTPSFLTPSLRTEAQRISKIS